MLRPILIFSMLLLGAAAWAVGADRDAAFEKARERMVRTQLQRRGISDPVTLEAMASVPRHLFVSPDLAEEAYTDGPLPIGFGQTISQPYIVAFMTETVRPGPKKKILEVGTGSGYQAAVLAETGAEVYTIEIIPELAESAAARLQRLGYAGVHVKEGDGYFGWEEHAPYDAVVVTAAAPFIPPPLLDQLKTGGRMLIPVGSPFLLQTLMLVEKGEEETISRSLMPVRFVPFRRDG
jgi:protein-L-isoaspartate(D-aspartate) O-methyltransferase